MYLVVRGKSTLKTWSWTTNYIICASSTTNFHQSITTICYNWIILWKRCRHAISPPRHSVISFKNHFIIYSSLISNKILLSASARGVKQSVINSSQKQTLNKTLGKMETCNNTGSDHITKTVFDMQYITTAIYKWT